MVKILTGLLLLAFLAAGQALEATPASCKEGDLEYLSVNPLGTCFCPGHLWVSDGCRAGFYCIEGQGTTAGCYKVRKIRIKVMRKSWLRR